MAGLEETLAVLRRRRERAASSNGASRMHDVANFGSNPGALRALLYTPQILAPKAALVVALHGCTQNGEGYGEGAGWLSLADRYGFAVLCPEQVRANNSNLCFNWFQRADTTRGEGEAESIAQMVRHVLASEALDARRVFITGLSAGGAMTAAMLAAYPEMFAAGAVIAGLPYGAAHSMPEAFAAMAQAPSRTDAAWGDLVRGASQHAGPWPRVAIWHGDADMTVRAGAGDALARQWTNVHALEHASGEAGLVGARNRTIWRAANGDPMVEHHSVHGMGHGTPLHTAGPDGHGAAAPHLLDVGISSSLETAQWWGLVDQRSNQPGAILRTPAQPSKKIDGPSPRLATVIPALAAKRDVNAIITSALRRAGLMK